MKVLVIINAHFGYDGISSVVKSYYYFQNHKKVHMDILTINRGDTIFEEEVEKNGNIFYCLEMRNTNTFMYFFKLIRIMRTGRYDIVHVHGNSATMAIELLAAYIVGIKCRIAHSHNTKCDHDKVHRLLFPIFRKLYTDCFACSKEAGEFLFSGKQFYVIKNGIDSKSYLFNDKIRKKIREKYSLEKYFVIGDVARLTYQKNQEFLIDVLAQIEDSNIALLLVGDGEDKEMLKNKVRKLGIENRVIFTGNVNNVNEIVQAMDMFAFPSRFEGLGIVALEAQASNLPCIISEEVPHEVKVLPTTQFANINSIEDWIRNICKLKKSYRDEIRFLTAERAVREVEHAGYDITENCKSLLRIYESLAK